MAAEQQPAPAPNPNRLFVGNLSFQTTAENLGKLFEQQGEVVEAIIVSRGQSSRGFGFVSMKTREAAQKAMNALNNYTLDGRQIRIEFSTSTGPHQPGSGPAPRPRFGRGRGRGGRGRGGRGRGGRGGRGRGGRGRGGRGRGRGGFRPNRQPRFNPNDPIVATRIHLGNLPYNLKDEELKTEFKDFNITEAIIIRGFNGRSHGYGFVECATPEESKKILDKFPTKEIGGRTVTLSQARVKHERPQQ